MRWNYLTAAIRPAVTAASAVLAGTLVLAGTTVLTGTAGAEALAATAGSRHFGTYRTWQAAQKAAGFKLFRPTRTYGHKRNGPIGVGRCELQKKSVKKVVTAAYGSSPFSMLWLSQNNSGKPCTDTGKVTRLGTYKVQGTKAVLSGKCGMKGLRSCKSTKIFLLLTWVRHGIYYQATSYGQPRSVLVGFAQGLRRVR